MKRLILGVTLVLSVAGTAGAQSQAQDSEDGRYSFHRVEDGFLRLDTRTGQVSLCGRKTVGWGCEMVPDERTALENEIARLQNDNVALKKDMLARGLPLPGAVREEPKSESKIEQKPDAPTARRTEPDIRLPDAADLERMRVFFDRFWRRLVEMITNLQKDMQKT